MTSIGEERRDASTFGRPVHTDRLISSGDTAEIRLNLSEHTVLVISNNIDITASFLPRQILSLLTQLLAYSLYVPARTIRTSSSCYKRELPH